MAKIAQCRYGSRGQGPENNPDKVFAYVVNDNVRTGDRIQVISTSSKGKKFPTTAVPIHAYGENTKKGQDAKQEAQQATGGQDPTQAYSGREVGATGSKKVPTTSKIAGLEPQSQYTMQTRAGNVAKYMQQHPDAQLTPHAQETYDSYAKQFINKGE